MPSDYARAAPSAATRRRRVAAGLALFLGAAGPAPVRAHEVPSRVTVMAFIRPEGRRLQLLMRVPLGAMRDMEFPLRGSGYLDLARAGAYLADAARLWLADYIHMYEGDRELGAPVIAATRVSLPSDRSFESFDEAIAHFAALPLPVETAIPWQQAMLDVALEYPIQSDRSRFSIEPSLGRLGIRTTTVLRFLPVGSGERAFQYLGDPGLVRLDPGWWHAAGRFVALGFQHIIDGLDHLLFVLCLVIPVRRVRPLVAIVTAFTAAHSITLIAAAAGLAPGALWFPPLIETLIALSIVYMAFENIVGARLERRWMMAFGFGLVHGFGFSFALRESMQFAGTHLLTSLLAFNVGVELGQLVVVAAAVPVLGWVFSRVVNERAGTILVSALVAHNAWHWMTDRATTLRSYEFSWPALDAAFAAAAMRFAMLALIILGVAWGMGMLVRRLAGTPEPRQGAPASP